MACRPNRNTRLRKNGRVVYWSLMDLVIFKTDEPIHVLSGLGQECPHA